MQTCLWNVCIQTVCIQHVLHSESWAGSICNILSHEIQIPTAPRPHQGSHLQVPTEGDSSLPVSLFYIQTTGSPSILLVCIKGFSSFKNMFSRVHYFIILNSNVTLDSLVIYWDDRFLGSYVETGFHMSNRNYCFKYVN